MAYDQETLDRLRQRLLSRRYVVVQSTLGNQREMTELKGQSRSAEMEEDAQKAVAEYVLMRLGESQRKEVAQIDAALARIDAGTYGECVDCGSTISLERLEVVPFALRDSECTAQLEAREEPGREYPTL